MLFPAKDSAGNSPGMAENSMFLFVWFSGFLFHFHILVAPKNKKLVNNELRVQQLLQRSVVSVCSKITGLRTFVPSEGLCQRTEGGQTEKSPACSYHRFSSLELSTVVLERSSVFLKQRCN